MVRILVTTASKHGATDEIGDAIAATLESAGIEAFARGTEEVSSLDDVDGVIVGSGVYAGHWMGQAKVFVERFQEDLRRRPVWLFSSGPLGRPPTQEDDPLDVALHRREIGSPRAPCLRGQAGSRRTSVSPSAPSSRWSMRRTVTSAIGRRFESGHARSPARSGGGGARPMTSLRASGTRPPRSRGTAWIVCAGSTRDVSDGRVQCPGRGVVGMSACLSLPPPGHVLGRARPAGRVLDRRMPVARSCRVTRHPSHTERERTGRRRCQSRKAAWTSSRRPARMKRSGGRSSPEPTNRSWS